jgi:hypothetical protein
MRKSLAFSLLTLFPLASSISLAAPGPKCGVQEKDEKGVAKGATGTWTNCWADEVFVLDGKEAGVGCFVDPMTMMPDAKNCVLGMYGAPPNPYNGEGTEAAARTALMKAGVGQSQYDQIVLFTADFGQADNANWDDAGPLFYRTMNTMAMKPVNEAGNIGLEVVPRDPAKPFVGVINAGNLKGAGNTPWTGNFGACGRNASICASGMFSYFDALAQATANLYGPYLKDPSEMVPPPMTAPPGTAPTTRLLPEARRVRPEHRGRAEDRASGWQHSGWLVRSALPSL